MARRLLEAARRETESSDGGGGCVLHGHTGNAKLAIDRDYYFVMSQQGSASGDCMEQDGPATFKGEMTSLGSGYVCRSGPNTLCFAAEGMANVTTTIERPDQPEITASMHYPLSELELPFECSDDGLTLQATYPLDPPVTHPLPFHRDE